MVFLSSSCRETAKKRDKNTSKEKNDRGKKHLSTFWAKRFRHGLPPKACRGVFLEFLTPLVEKNSQK
jgi:hypothetical protein